MQKEETYTNPPSPLTPPPEKGYHLVGQSPKLRHVLRTATKLGRGNWPVLVLGETGTGKELVARTVHGSGQRGPFVTIDCSSMVGPLMESELFGHVKGAFTGAYANKIGLIEQANGGTAFLDEIGELPLDLQSKLLRVLQEREFRPVGSLQLRQSSFRIIAATNRDLQKEVQRGTFRQDLYYRLNVVTLRLAPLRERKEDLPELIDHFLTVYGQGHSVSMDLRDLMMAYDWPGNVRELEKLHPAHGGGQTAARFCIRPTPPRTCRTSPASSTTVAPPWPLPRQPAPLTSVRRCRRVSTRASPARRCCRW